MAAVFKKTLDVERIVRDRVLDQANSLLALIGVNYAKGYCPVDTGNLRGSINFRLEGKEAFVGTKTEYAAYVEFGTRFQKAQPYIEPSIFHVRNRVGQVVDIFRKEVR